MSTCIRRRSRGSLRRTASNVVVIRDPWPLKEQGRSAIWEGVISEKEKEQALDAGE